MVLGIDWLKSTNPQIDWAACSFTCVVNGNSHVLSALPACKVAQVELSSLKQVCNDVKRGGAAWFGLVRPTEWRDTMEVLASLEVGDGVETSTTPPSRWDKLCTEF